MVNLLRSNGVSFNRFFHVTYGTNIIPGFNAVATTGDYATMEKNVDGLPNAIELMTSIYLSGTMKDMEYHNPTNIKLGKGDPCRLAGKTAVQIKAMNDDELMNYDSGWRLPTLTENQQYANANTAALKTLTLLPAAGCINDNGTVVGGSFGNYGDYWSSTVSNNTSGRTLVISTTSIMPSGSAGYAYSYAIRCVRK